MMSKKMKRERKEAQANAAESEVVEKLDVISLLQENKLDTKPNVAKFLKAYAQSIRIATFSKIDLWPKIHYDISKCVVRFKDQSSLIKDYCKEMREHYFYYRDLDEVCLREKDVKLIENFFNALEQFKFIRNGNSDVKVFSCDVEKTNLALETELSCQ